MPPNREHVLSTLFGTDARTKASLYLAQHVDEIVYHQQLDRAVGGRGNWTEYLSSLAKHGLVSRGPLKDGGQPHWAVEPDPVWDIVRDLAEKLRVIKIIEQEMKNNAKEAHRGRSFPRALPG